MYYFKETWNTLKLAFKTLFKLVGISVKQLSYRVLISDFLFVLFKIGFVAIPSLLFGVLLLSLPQGRDTFFIVIEQNAANNPLPFLGMLIGSFCWSFANDIAVRYAIAIADNAGSNLSDQRVFWRVSSQRILSAVFLFFPLLIIFLGLLQILFSTGYMSFPDKIKYIAIPLCFVAIQFVIITYFYHHKYGRSSPNRPRRTLLGKRSLPYREQNWLSKLIGIYKDYIFRFPKSTAFKGQYRKELADFTEKINEQENLECFPQDVRAFRLNAVLPKEFILINKRRISESKGFAYKWVYRIPNSFFSGLHRQVRTVGLGSLAVLLIVSFLPGESSVFKWFGAPGLICLAFGCYTGLYAGVLYIDKALLRNFIFSFRLLLVIILIICSVINNDHPSRNFKTDTKTRTSVSSDFRQWFADYQQKMGSDTLPADGQKYPVLFICAEGGAFRTAAYSAIFLSQIEYTFSRFDRPADFRSSVFGMSGVSGGAVGLGYYNAMAFRMANPLKADNVLDVERFFSQDALSPIIGRMFFSEFVNLFIPFHINRFDRAITLEKNWEKQFRQLFPNQENTYAAPFLKADQGTKPVFIVNTTEVETGYQCWLTNIEPDSILFKQERDLLKTRINNLPYSTAINFSSRFPLFSPAAMVLDPTYGKRHFVDGGYVENTGSASMLELLKILKSDTAISTKIRPIVIMLRFAPDDLSVSSINIANELTEVLWAAYNVRAGNTRSSRERIREFVEDWNDGFTVDAPLCRKEVPMNWVLSKRSMNQVKEETFRILRDSVIQKLYHGIRYIPLRQKDQN